jgi:cytochrome c oxidase assembly protein subunit 15
MMDTTSLYDFSPVGQLLLGGAALALLPLLWIWLRNRNASPLTRHHALALLTLFLTFDLVLFGAFTRLTDSGLGCPDWPGCYGSASPIGANEKIEAAQAVMPTGPVTHGKAWVEMVHRYLATSVGGLIVLLTVLAWRRKKVSAMSSTTLMRWSVLTLVWVCVQGAFGALTVTMKLFPAIVTLHLLGGYVLLALLMVQVVLVARQQPQKVQRVVPARLRFWVALALALLMVQAASGAWVSTNYAVLACTEFPMCQGSWWPQMDFAHGFELWRPLGYGIDGALISFQALTAMHFMHRLLAVVTLLLLAALVWPLRGVSAMRKPSHALAALLLLQLGTGLSNVVLDWPIVAAVLHTGGAGAMVVVLVWLLVSTSAALPTEPQPSTTAARAR